MAGEQEQLVASIETALKSRYGDASLESMKKLFDSYDANKDGKIDKDELTKLLKDVDIGNTFTRGAWAKGIIDKLDTNGDKAISWEEFQVVATTSA
jgi:Ca2+-binding EF-hand superfamily protein